MGRDTALDDGEAGSGVTTFLVTGASRGVGRWLVRHLHEDGHQVIGACRSPDSAHALSAIGAPVVRLDVTDDASIAALPAAVRSHTDTIDVLVNNAGIKRVDGRTWEASAGPLGALDRDALIAVLDTNVVGALMVTQGMASMLRRPGGVVVNVSSQLGSLAGGVDLDYAYNCSKAALNMATVSMQRDLGASGITVVSLNPGWMRTDMAGDEAPLEVSSTTREIADLLTTLDERSAGSFVDRFGHTVPW